MHKTDIPNINIHILHIMDIIFVIFIDLDDHIVSPLMAELFFLDFVAGIRIINSIFFVISFQF